MAAAAAICPFVPTRITADDVPPPYVVPFTQVRKLRSAINGVAYRLYVRLPRSYGHGTRRYPVMLMLDADFAFSIAVNISDKLAARNQAREAILVAVAYPGYPDESAYRLNRTRDYTPYFVASGGYGAEYQRYSGGAPKFASVIADEILPLVDRQYRTLATDRMFVGHSYGGLFGAYLLASRPAMFANYLLVSPSLWYDDRRALQDARAAGAPPMKVSTRIYLAVGRLEGSNGGRSMADDLRTFAGILAARRDPKLSVEFRAFEDETHDSVFPAAFSTGLRHLFAPPTPAGEP